MTVSGELIGRPYVGRSGNDPSTGQTVEAGNTLDLAYDTSNISGGAPAGWGSTCERYVIGATNGGCYRYKSFNEAEASRRGYRTEFEFLLVAENYSGAQVNTVAISKAVHKSDGTVGTLGDALRNWRLFIGDKSAFGYNVFLFMIGEDDSNDHLVVWPSSPGIVLNTAYKVAIEYDLVAGEIRWWMNDALIATISREAYIGYTTRDMPFTVAHQIMGGSSSSDGRNAEFLLDNVVWSEIPLRGGINLRPGIFRPGLAR